MTALVDRTLTRPRLRHRLLLALLMLVSVGTGLILSIVGPTVPAMATHLGVPESALGVVFGANFLVGAVSTGLAGHVLDRLGPRVLLPVGMAAMALGALGEGVATSLPLLTACAALAGSGVGVINVSNNVTAGLLFPERREAALNALNASFGAGAFLAPVLVSLSLAHLGGYLPAYIATAFVLAVPVAPLLLRLPRHVALRRGAVVSPRGLLRERALWTPALVGFLYLGAEIGFGGWIVALLQRLAHVSPLDAAPAAAAFWLFLALGGIPTGLLLHRGVPAARLLTAGACGAALACAALVAVGSWLPAAIAASALIGLGFAPIFPLNIAAAAQVGLRRLGGAAGSATSLVLVASQLGAAAIPALQGVMLHMGPGPAIAVTCACSVLIASMGLAPRFRA